ncbi:MAG: hypothetical protein F4160_00615 [Rhodospirillaceae bacterium]|nr:hypothetical protein [Rhodospirillaceae bacterium]MYH35286.1 hypothetical protein [Rhodospirillaceae bacterium]MYK13823.1 hypothetical protein [Rhodospirillaceae bacterium]
MTAISKIEAVYRASAVDRKEAARLIGYSSQSGPANKALADLAAYGLLQRAGKGEARVTERALAILHPNSDTERSRALEDAALEPPLYRELRERFEGAEMPPPEEGVINHLNRKGFNPRAVLPAARAFLSTMEYMLTQESNDSHRIEPSNEEEPTPSDAGRAPVTYGGARVGDFIQWECRGQFQFKEPKRVRAIEVYDDAEWVFVENEKGGVPMEQAIVEMQASDAAGVSLQRPELPLEARPAPQDEIEWMRNRVGKETNVRLLVTGDMGPREIGRLIRLLETQQSILEDEDNESNA